MDSQAMRERANDAISLTYIPAHCREIDWHLSANKFLKEYLQLTYTVMYSNDVIKRLEKVRLKLLEEKKELRKEIRKLKRKLRNETA
jgi:hypothetical protein